MLRESDMQQINHHKDNHHYIKLIVTPALGGIMSYSKKIGYLEFGKEIRYIFSEDFTEYYLPK